MSNKDNPLLKEKIQKAYKVRLKSKNRVFEYYKLSNFEIKNEYKI